MNRRALVPCLALLISAVWAGPPAAARGQRSVESSSAEHAAVLNKYCVACHNDKQRTGGLSLQQADLTDVPKNAETWEKVDPEVAHRHDASARNAAAGPAPSSTRSTRTLKPLWIAPPLTRRGPAVRRCTV